MAGAGLYSPTDRDLTPFGVQNGRRGGPMEAIPRSMMKSQRRAAAVVRDIELNSPFPLCSLQPAMNLPSDPAHSSDSAIR